jgi:hypothetical protein
MNEFRKAVLIAAAGIALTPGDLSLFAVALSIINIMNFGVSAVDVAFSQRLSRTLTGDEADLRDKFLAVSGAIKLAGFALGCVLVAIFGYWALGWFGPLYQTAWPALLVLTLIPGLAILFGPGSVILSTCGLGREDFIANAVGAIVTVLAVAAGSALGGLTGAALGSVAGCTASQALMALYCMRRLGIDPTLTSLRHLRQQPDDGRGRGMTLHQAEIGTAGPVSGHEVLLVVPTLNEARGIEACLRSLLTGDPRLADADVIVADGGSHDATRQIVAALGAEFPRLRLIDNPARLQSAGINRAVAEAATDRHRILVRADAHAIYPPGYAMALADRLAALAVASVVVPMDSRGKGCFQRAAAWIVDTPLGSGGSAHRGGRRSGEVDHGHHAAMDLDWFHHVGGYDARFSHNEDAELDHRLRAAGGRIWLEADLRLDYQMRPSVAWIAGAAILELRPGPGAHGAQACAAAKAAPDRAGGEPGPADCGAVADGAGGLRAMPP